MAGTNPPLEKGDRGLYSKINGIFAWKTTPMVPFIKGTVLVMFLKYFCRIRINLTLSAEKFQQVSMRILKSIII